MLPSSSTPTLASNPALAKSKRITVALTHALPFPLSESCTLPSRDRLKSAPMTSAQIRRKKLFISRDASWLNFNRRVLEEAEDERNPLLERVKFLAITGSNLDEFFMKRIGGLKQQAAAGIPQPTVDGRTPQQQIAECFAWVRAFERDRLEVERRLLELLAE